MGAWLDRLKIQKAPDTYATKPTKPAQNPVAGGFVGFVAYPPGVSGKSEGGSVGFVAYPQGHSEKFEGVGQQPDTPAANDPAPDPDGDCWPHSSAMNSGEIELFNRRAALFVRRGASDTEAERLAETLVQCDREGDGMHACMECRHLQGNAPWRCGNWRAAGVAVRAGDAGLARAMAMQAQRCPGFADAALPASAAPFVAGPVGPQAAPDPVQPQASGPDRSPTAPWRELDRTYLAHHAQCNACQCAGRGYGERCDVGALLWAAYLAESSI